jgi:hypothetical protein
MDETELRGPGPFRAFAPVWFVLALLLFLMFVMPVLFVLLLRLAGSSFQIG